MTTRLPALLAAVSRESEKKPDIASSSSPAPKSLEVRPPQDQRPPSSLRPNGFLRRASGLEHLQGSSSKNASTEFDVCAPKYPQPSNCFRRSQTSETSTNASEAMSSCSRIFSSDLETLSSIQSLGSDRHSPTPSVLDMDEAQDLIWEVKDIILKRVPEAQVVLICTTKPQPTENLTVIGHLDTLEFPVAPADVPALVLLVENSPKCVSRASTLLRTGAGHAAPRLAFLLMNLEFGTDSEVLTEHITSLIDSGAHDAIACYCNCMDLPSAISTSFARANVRKQQNHVFARKVQKARNQSDQLFWKHAHDFIEGFPTMKSVREVPGKIVENMVFDRKLGQGSFGTVYEFKEMGKERSGAVKVISKSEVSNLDHLCDIADEYKVLRKLSGHPNVVEGFAIVHARQNIYIFMELAGTSSLASVLKKEQERGLPAAEVNSVFKCISDALAHCHKLRVAHCDLKPENMVVAPDGSVKIVDFGDTEDLDGDIMPLTHPRGTMPFTAPEILRLQDPWNPAASDMWALGVVLMELLCGYDALPRIMRWPRRALKPLPERADELMVVFSDFGTLSNSFQAVKQVCRDTPTAAISSILTGMLQVIPEERLLAADVVHQFSQLS